MSLVELVVRLDRLGLARVNDDRRVLRLPVAGHLVPSLGRDGGPGRHVSKHFIPSPRRTTHFSPLTSNTLPSGWPLPQFHETVSPLLGPLSVPLPFLEPPPCSSSGSSSLTCSSSSSP